MNETRADFLKNVLPVIFPEFAAGSQERRACQDGLRRVWEMFGSGAAVFNYRAVDWVGLRVDEARRDGKPLNAYLDRDLEVMRRMTAHSTPNARIVPLNRWVFDGIINYPGPIFGLKTKEGIAAILARNCTSHGFVM